MTIDRELPGVVRNGLFWGDKAMTSEVACEVKCRRRRRRVRRWNNSLVWKEDR